MIEFPALIRFAIYGNKAVNYFWFENQHELNRFLLRIYQHGDRIRCYDWDDKLVTIVYDKTKSQHEMFLKRYIDGKH